MCWRIYYSDGSTYSAPGIEEPEWDGVHESGPMEHAPGLGVIVIAQQNEEVGRYLHSRKDYYWISEGREWVGGDIFGLWDYLQRPGLKKVVFGRTVEDKRYKLILQRAVEDRGLPRKSARHWDEPKV